MDIDNDPLLQRTFTAEMNSLILAKQQQEGRVILSQNEIKGIARQHWNTLKPLIQVTLKRDTKY